MVNYVLAAVIAVSVAGVIAAYFALRTREQRRIPSLNSLRDASRRGVQREIIRSRTDSTSQDALNGMISDLDAR